VIVGLDERRADSGAARTENGVIKLITRSDKTSIAVDVSRDGQYIVGQSSAGRPRMVPA